LKKFVAILFLTIYVVSATELHEFFKLPQLVEHFIEHKSKNSKTTLIDFLTMHYTSSKDGNSHDTDDTQLPYKSHQQCENLSHTGFISFHNFELSIKTIPIEAKSYNTYSSEFISSSYLSSIWQPPKSC
jgi:hypothetical protein